MMNTLRRTLVFLAAASAALAALAQARPLPLEYWALREAIREVEASPSGKYFAMMKIESREGNPIIEIREVADLAKKPIRLNADPMEFTSLTWISDDLLVINARQKVRSRIDGVNAGVYEFKAISYSIAAGEFTELSDNLQIEGLLPDNPDEVLVSTSRINASVTEGDPFAAFRPREYKRLNLRRGTSEFILKGNDRIAQASFDVKGNPRFAQGYDAGSREFVFYTRSPSETTWRELLRIDSFDQSTFAVVGFDNDDVNKGYAIANNGNDKVGLYEIDLRSGKLGKLLFRDELGDVAGAVSHSDDWNKAGVVVGAAYYGDRIRTHYFDTADAREEEALFKQLESLIPNAYNLNITTRSRDGNVMTIFNSGPRDSGSYYLLAGGQLQYVGTQHALIKPEDLNDVEFVRYEARDGLMIPAYITKPKGKGPWPAVILPHGGPEVPEVIGFDEWGQMLANNGFLVLQPGFRVTQGWGLKHYEAALGGGAWGGSMQDDKEDAVTYLVERGLTERDGAAIFGWSYGGYAALAAAVRGNDFFQCAISGAPVANLPESTADFTRGGIPASIDFLRTNRTGTNPVDEAENVNIPLMLVHGSVDQRVPIKHANQMARAMDRAGKPYRYEILKGADHFSNTLYYEHQIQLYTAMIDFLNNDCGLLKKKRS
ncbi:MAG: prolyl oligopeptidase family serine peptidase [Pseudomonadota bacterium]